MTITGRGGRAISADLGGCGWWKDVPRTRPEGLIWIWLPNLPLRGLRLGRRVRLAARYLGAAFWQTAGFLCRWRAACLTAHHCRWFSRWYSAVTAPAAPSRIPLGFSRYVRELSGFRPDVPACRLKKAGTTVRFVIWADRGRTADLAVSPAATCQFRYAPRSDQRECFNNYKPGLQGGAPAGTLEALQDVLQIDDIAGTCR